MNTSIRAALEGNRLIETRTRDLAESFMRKHLPGEVRDVNVAIGTDYDGEPALFIELFVPDDEHPTPDKVRRYADAISALQSILSDHSEGYFPFVNLRKAG